MKRIVLTVFVLYAGFLMMIVGLRQSQLATNINNLIAETTVGLIEKNPVDHKQTLFSGVLQEHAIKTSPHNVINWTRTGAAYELVTMNPCNPRINRCG